DGFFEESPTDRPSEDVQVNAILVNPNYFNESEDVNTTKIETVRIGKEDKANTKNRFRLTGYVRNAKTGEAIPNLSLVVKNRNMGVVTDDEGYYSIELPSGLNILETRSMGMERAQKNVILFSDGTLDISLNENIEQLEEVVVAADAARNVEEAITGSTQIDSEESKNIPLVLGERDILKIATTLPGVSTAGEGAAGYNVRGGNTDQNLILLDDGVIYNPSHFFGIFQALNPYATKDVTIYKGNIPAQYGGRLSSVFDIRTKDSNVEKFAGEASIGPVTNNVVLEIPLVKEKSSVLVGGRSSYSDWILRSLKDERLSNSTASFYDLIAKFNANINENNDFKATAYYSKDAFSITSDSLYKYSNRMFTANWNHRINDRNTANVNLANTEYRFTIGYDGPSNNDFDLGFKINETDLKLRFNYLHSDTHKFTYGLEGKLYNSDPGYIEPNGAESNISPLVIPRERGFESALFLSDSYTISEKFLVDIGLRYSFFAALGAATQRYYQGGVPKNEATLTETKEFGSNEVIKTYSGPEVRASARYFLAPEFSVKASYNSTLQYIHTLSNTTTVSPIDTWKLADANIKPARAHQYSLGLYKNLDANNYELSLEGYYKTSSDILDFKVGAQLLLNETIEAEVLQGEGKAYGVELLLRKNRGDLNGWLGYTYSRTMIKFDSDFSEERINNGEFFPSNYDKPHDFSAVLNYKLTRRFSLSTNFIYQTGRPVTYPVGRYTFNNTEYVYYSNRNEFRIPDYFRLDIGLNVEGNHRIKKFAHSFWTLSIYNLLGRNNPYSVYFVTEGGELKAYKSSIFAVPIPSITYSFKF
ncbi:MAG: TonB-dependent receptor, partial [Flavobacteriaceae bacterium]